MENKKKLLTQTHFAFNIWDFESARAVIDASASARQDVILQTSAGIYKTMPAKVFADFVKEYAMFQGIHAWLSLDHCNQKELLFSAVDNGWDMVMADGSALPIQENVLFTNEVAVYAHARGVFVEAEIGQVKGAEDGIMVQEDAISSKEEIASFSSLANADFIAVAFGNAHGLYAGELKLHYDLVEYTTSVTDKPFVVHGGSGMPDTVLKRLIAIKGVRKINISTDLKNAYRTGIRKADRHWNQPKEASNLLRDEIARTAVSKVRLLSCGGDGQ